MYLARVQKSADCRHYHIWFPKIILGKQNDQPIFIEFVSQIKSNTGYSRQMMHLISLVSWKRQFWFYFPDFIMLCFHICITTDAIELIHVVSLLSCMIELTSWGSSSLEISMIGYFWAHRWLLVVPDPVYLNQPGRWSNWINAYLVHNVSADTFSHTLHQ
jgi:hypothetical protein